MKRLILPIALLTGTLLAAQQTKKDTVQATQIQEVTVTKKAFQKKADRFVYDVASAPQEKGNTAFGLLTETPLISSTDDKTLKIAGKSNAVIYINGKKTRMSQDALVAFLKSTPASNIQRIEVITMPGSQYDVESTDGIINIVLKKKADNGLNGSFQMTNAQRYHNNPSASVSVNYRHNKLGIDANFNTRESHQHQYYLLRNGNNTSSNQSEGTVDSEKKGLGGYINMDYAFNDKNSLALSYNAWFSKTPLTEINLFNTLSYLDHNNVAGSSYTRTLSKENEHSSNNSLNLNYQLKTDSLGSKLNLNVAYLHFNDLDHNNNSTLTAEANGLTHPSINEKPINRIQQTTPQVINNFSAMADYVQKFKNDFTLSGGAHLNHTKTDNNLQSTTTMYDPTTGMPSVTSDPDHFIYNENILGFYITAEKSFSDKLSATLGLRDELTQSRSKSLDATQTNLQNINRTYNNLLPYLNINYAISPQHNLSYAFSSRVRRPSFWEINPAREYLTQYNYIQNNPFVKASSTYSQEMTYMYHSAYFLIIGYDIANHNIQQIPLQRPMNIDVPVIDSAGNPVIDPTTGLPETSATTINELRYIRTNFGTSKTLSISLGLQKSFFHNYWNLNGTISFQQGRIDGSLDTDPITGEKFSPYINHIKQNSLSLQINNNIRLDSKKTWYAGVNFWYAGKQPLELGILDPMSNLNLSIKKVWNDWTFAGTFTNVLDSQNININQPSGNSNFNHVFQKAYMRGFQLTISYNFGNKKVKQIRKIQTATEDIKSRTK